MAEPTHVIEIVTGIGEPSFVPLTVGKEQPPLSIGRRGMWQVNGTGILDVHAYVYFDGQSLFLQSADGGNTANVDGFPVDTSWTELRPPCIITLGGARLEYREEDKDEHTRAIPAPAPVAPPDPDSSGPPSLITAPRPLPAAGRPPPPSPGLAATGRPSAPSVPAPVAPRAPSRPFEPGAFASRPDDGESTRVAPLDLSGSRGRVSVGPALGSGAFPNFPQQGGPFPTPGQLPGGGFSRPSASGSFPQPGVGFPPSSGGFPQQGAFPGGAFPDRTPGFPPVGPAGPGFPGAGSSAGPMPLHDFNQGASPEAPAAPVETDALKKALADFRAASPVRKLTLIILPFAMLAAGLILLADDPPPAPRTARPDAGSEAGALTAVAEGGAPSGADPLTPPVVPTGALPDGGWTTMPTTPPVTPPVAPTARPVDAGADAAGLLSLERQAVDAVFAGNTQRAAELYEQLAREQANNPSYSYAARILRERLDSGAP